MSVDKLNIATCNTFESDAGDSTKPLEAFSPLESFRVKWITLFKITWKSWSLTYIVFKTRKRNSMKMFKIKTHRKLPHRQYFWSTFNDVPISDNILPLFVMYSVVHVLLRVFNRIKEGFGSDHRIVMVFHLLMSFCLFLKFMKGLLTKVPLFFLPMHRYHQSTVFKEYSIYWRAIDHPRVLPEVSWLKPSSALMKKSRWKLVVNRWHKMTFIKWYFWPTGSLYVEEANFSEVVESFPMSFMSCCIIGNLRSGVPLFSRRIPSRREKKYRDAWSQVTSLVLNDAALDCHQYSQVLELAKSLQFY